MKKLIVPKQVAGIRVVKEILKYYYERLQNGMKIVSNAQLKQKMRELFNIQDSSEAVKQTEMLRYFDLVKYDYKKRESYITERGKEFYKAYFNGDQDMQNDIIADVITSTVFGKGAKFKGGNTAIKSSDSPLDAPKLFVKGIATLDGITREELSFLIRTIQINEIGFDDACTQLEYLQDHNANINNECLEQGYDKMNDPKFHAFLENIGFVKRDDDKKYHFVDYVKNKYQSTFENIDIFNQAVQLRQYDDPNLIDIDVNYEYSDDVDCSDEYQSLVQEEVGYQSERETKRQDNRKPEKNKSNKGSGYKTNPKLGKTRLREADFLCEVDPTHNTFQRKNRKGKMTNQYMEPHHLLPMKAQADYEGINIDRMSNLVCLCPNCHRQVHLGTVEEQKKILDKILPKRFHEFLKETDIQLTEDELFDKYYK